jgi:hypothetical protein
LGLSGAPAPTGKGIAKTAKKYIRRTLVKLEAEEADMLLREKVLRFLQNFY